MRADGSKGVAVRRSSIHGRGVFALRRFRAGARIGELRGPRTRREGAHVLWLEDDRGISGRNAFRYVNHSLRPNAEFDGAELRARRNIQPGREITVHYGEDWAETE